jgi:UDP-N-acetylglucosamine 3-dehydrogenase
MINVAVIGTGGLGSRQVLNFAGVPGCRVQRVFDLDRTAAEAAAAPVGAEVAASLDECLGEDIQAVVVVTPTPAHAAPTLAAVAAGKHVFCEKPMARTVADAERMVQAAQDAGVQLMIGHVVRFFPAYLTAHEQIRKGELGQVGMARMSRINLPPSKPWYQDYSQSGGALHDLAIHDLDWLTWTFGMPVRVYARNRADRLPALDYGLASLRFAGGEIAHVEGSFADAGGFRTSFDLAGSGGLLRHDSAASPTLVVQRRGEAGAAPQTIPSAPAAKSPYQVQAEAFLAALREGTPVPVSGEEGLRTLRVSLACLESADTGQVMVLEGDRYVPATGGERDVR